MLRFAAQLLPRTLRASSRPWRGRARQIDVPASLRGLSTLPRVDYADAFLTDTRAHPDWTAERWARAVLEGASPATRAELLAGWSTLGLKSTESDASVLGWAIRRQTAESTLLGRDSRVGMPGELLFSLGSDGLLFATFVHHRWWVTRAVWSVFQRSHVRTVLALLDRAARGVGAATSP